MSRPPAVPFVGMEVRIVYLATEEVALVEEVRDDGRTLLVAGQTFTLRRLTGKYVREGEPNYGVRLALR